MPVPGRLRANSRQVVETDFNARMSTDFLPNVIGLLGLRRRCRQPESKRKLRSERESDRDAGDACRPAEAIEELAEDHASHDAPEEIAREVDAAGGTPVGRCRTPNESRCSCLCEEGAHTDQCKADEDRGEA